MSLGRWTRYLLRRLRREQPTATPAGVYAKLIEYLLSAGYRVAEADPQERRVFLAMRGAHACWTTVLRVWEPLPVVTVISRIDEPIAESDRLVVLGKLNQVNCYSKLFGNWEMSPDDGRLYFRTSAVIRSLAGASDVFRDLVDGNHASVDTDLSDILPVDEGVDGTPRAEVTAAARPAIH